ncbi:MAG: polysaccharide biosynthesis C-terminal domain-containing protein [Candidatus Staskawiczbacteria bacterium]|nr:polysaccharide biosynthesis C-terminal domain-containing protein [Candidatus Staskawiczbacteria bacterium]
MIIFSVAVVGILFLLILLILKNYISQNLFFLMQIGVLLFIVYSLGAVPCNLLRAKRNVTQYSIFSIWNSVAGLTIGITIILFFHIGIEGLLWGNIISSLISAPLSWRISLGMPSFKDGYIFSHMSWEIAKYGIPTIIINVLSWAQSLSDRYILGFFRGSIEVGIYSPNYTIAESGMFLITSLFLMSSTPIGFDIWENKGVEESKEFMNKVTRYYLIIALPAAMGLSILAKTITYILVAPQYYAGYIIIPLVAFGAFFVGLAHRFTTGLAYHKRTGLLMFCYLGSIILNAFLNLIFIPKYGYMAAAFSTFIAYLSLLFFSAFVSRFFFIWKFPFKSLVKCFLASIIMGGGVYFLINSLHFNNFINLLLAIIFGVAVYFILIILFKEITLEEKMVIKIFVKKVFNNN